MTYALATADGSFFAAPHQGDLYRSRDAGRSWVALGVAWPGGDERPYVQGLAAIAS
jgi:hypothetical protein